MVFLGDAVGGGSLIGWGVIGARFALHVVILGAHHPGLLVVDGVVGAGLCSPDGSIALGEECELVSDVFLANSIRQILLRDFIHELGLLRV